MRLIFQYMILWGILSANIACSSEIKSDTGAGVRLEVLPTEEESVPDQELLPSEQEVLPQVQKKIPFNEQMFQITSDKDVGIAIATFEDANENQVTIVLTRIGSDTYSRVKNAINNNKKDVLWKILFFTYNFSESTMPNEIVLPLDRLINQAVNLVPIALDNRAGKLIIKEIAAEENFASNLQSHVIVIIEISFDVSFDRFKAAGPYKKIETPASESGKQVDATGMYNWERWWKYWNYDLVDHYLIEPINFKKYFGAPYWKTSTLFLGAGVATILGMHIHSRGGFSKAWDAIKSWVAKKF